MNARVLSGARSTLTGHLGRATRRRPGPGGATLVQLVAWCDRWAWLLALLAIALCSDYKR